MKTTCLCFLLTGLFVSFPVYAFDINGDGREGLEEAIHALQVVAGMIPDRTSEGDAATDDVLAGKVFSSDNGTGLTGTRPAAPTAQTGQKSYWYSRDDGSLEYGVATDGDRFTTNGDGTFTDNQTGLTWLFNSNCYGTIQWTTAMANANNLANGTCDLTDGSEAGDWRLPNIRELFSLVDFGEFVPALPDSYPTTFALYDYWSSTTRANDSSEAWSLYFDSGDTSYRVKSETAYFIAVKGGITD